MADYLVNGLYPMSYLQLNGVDQIRAPDQFWWSSHQRFAAVNPVHLSKYLSTDNGGTRTSEYLEIDLGRIRQINWMSMSIMRSPLDIEIDFDPVSASDSRQWVSVAPHRTMPFDDRIHYDADVKNPWFRANYYFTDGKGDMVNTRYLRIRFQRRDINWPTKDTDPFRWPVSVKNLRTARYVLNLDDAKGPLIDTGIGSQILALVTADQALGLNTSYEVRQNFQLPEDALRANISPDILGFGVLVDVPEGIDGNSFDPSSEVSYSWSLWDATNPNAPVRLKNGIEAKTLNSGKAWLDIYFDPQAPVETSPTANTVYQVRLRSLNVQASGSVYYSLPTKLSGQNFYTWNGTNYTAHTDRSLSIRVWGDVADSGRDILGNFYRYGVRRDKGSNVFDADSAGWISAPQPSTEAVEALYFDVRTPNSRGIPDTTVIDALRVSPKTRGIRMHVYWSAMNLTGRRPQSQEEWDLMIWTPVNQVYILRQNGIFQLPKPISAGYVKLEFSSLKPLPFSVPNHPKFPPVRYRRYPTWIEDQFNNATIRRTVEDWFLKNETPVMRQIIKEITDPVLEFQYKEREFLASLALGRFKDKAAVNAGLVDIKHRTLIDPITASRIYLSDKDMYKSTLTVNVDRDSLLGQLVLDRFDPAILGDPLEGQVNTLGGIPAVSTANDRISESFSHLAQTPMWFNRSCRHVYKHETAEFNKKAYFAAVQAVEFLRKDYTQTRDETSITDTLTDATMLDTNTFSESKSSTLLEQL